MKYAPILVLTLIVSAAEPQFTADGQLVRPADYREWIYLSSGLGMNYNESNALAKEEEEDFLYRAMQADVVAQVMRRLAALPATPSGRCTPSPARTSTGAVCSARRRR